ncbi:sodium/potassium-transporting ATPase subunit alpha [Salpingoeca rosetta]|uniref:Sodium/potassium-transporting ATPase subunit alpha n=1 Tax=Salpingoeca rosetta (strain ATCC 50818 / BSB-021) TaxID=946362 RepID=F2UJY4_SALR5|nr:sodium/potassium-transporting ATPase subunit alpha [Salpingoeca rosetta]EGD77433.1 sodium/potassium-transporting ATPase subunit alpha [Salpingoeca rosetta]|eukprot:XP_004990321.1 sodium/potassium-transporting ATPase subunit alpha [Salpingoeca rosetta]
MFPHHPTLIPQTKHKKLEEAGHGPATTTNNHNSHNNKGAEEQATAGNEHVQSIRDVADSFPKSRIVVSEDGALKSAQGLSTEEAQHRLEEDGPNVLTPPKRTPQWVIFLRQLLDPFMLMLLAAAILSWVAYGLDTTEPLNLWLGVILFAVVLVTSFMSFLQERKTSNLMSLFADLSPPKALVVRDGAQMEVEAAHLVVGDIIVFKEGDIVPADVRILHCSALRVECSSLTGESTPIVGTVEAATPGTAAHEATCLGFSGSQCLQGSATAVVVRTGDNTMIGKIASATAAAGSTDTRLGREVTSFVRFVAVLAISMAAVFFAIGVGRQKGDNALYIFINGFLIVIVANVPQGLPATVTSLLTITARRMAANNMFVKRLAVVETLGSASVIASDKTGTITQNRMSARALWSNRVVYTDLGSHNLTAAFPTAHNDTTTLHWLSTVACVCNHATRQMTKSVSDESEYIGNPSDAALLQLTDRHYHTDLRRKQFDIVGEIPFNSRNKWQLVIGRPTDPRVRAAANDSTATATTTPAITATSDMDVAMLKGAPEIVLSKCDSYMMNGEVIPINADFEREFTAALERFGGKSWRVIGLCARLVPRMTHDDDDDDGEDDTELTEDNAPLEGYVLLGLCALADPPRPNVDRAVAACRTAGIKVYMVTGDHALTAAAIAREVGILTSTNGGDIDDEDEHHLNAVAHHPAADPIPGEFQPGVYMSHSVDKFTDDHWRRVLSLPGAVFARATPQQKLTIVEACQRFGEIVAVTGDGVNDAPALKQADIGIAMGIKGNAVAKEAADTLLMDDNFASIVLGVEQGRLIMDNLRKTIRYLLTHLMPEIVPVLMNLALGLPIGLTSLQILSIDLGTEMAAGISLAYEPAEPGIMKRRPRSKKKKMVNRELLTYSYLIAGGIEMVACFLAYVHVFSSHGLTLGDVFLKGDNHFRANPDPLCLSDGRCFTPAQQEEIAGQATAAWYMTLILGQAVHLWVIKSGRVSIFRTNPLNNIVAVYGAIVAVCIMLILVYVPGLQVFVGARTPEGITWVFFLIAAAGLIAYTELKLLWKKRRTRRRRRRRRMRKLRSAGTECHHHALVAGSSAEASPDSSCNTSYIGTCDEDEDDDDDDHDDDHDDNGGRVLHLDDHADSAVHEWMLAVV